MLSFEPPRVLGKMIGYGPSWFRGIGRLSCEVEGPGIRLSGDGMFRAPSMRSRDAPESSALLRLGYETKFEMKYCDWVDMWLPNPKPGEADVGTLIAWRFGVSARLNDKVPLRARSILGSGFSSVQQSSGGRVADSRLQLMMNSLSDFLGAVAGWVNSVSSVGWTGSMLTLVQGVA